MQVDYCYLNSTKNIPKKIVVELQIINHPA